MPTFQQDLKDTAVQLVKSLECPICLEILRDPLSTSCHHRFCRLCLEKALQDNYKIPCPLCKAVVTKRSLTQSDLIVKLVDKVKQLVQAVKNDTGVEVTPPKSQLEPANASLERRSVHSAAQKAATSCKSSLSFGSRATNKRAFVVHTDDGPNRHPPRAAESRDAGAARGPAACAVHTRGPEREGDAWAEASSSLSPQLDADIGAASKRPRPTSIAV
ncbi:breast cancer type 1 susceptibility protein homolog [Rhipicephalus sanguineus]|uniref:breast cancer type 1 susceptibility protein homolog n=1 Tax=Rhipicephalus sanguineus TaxID=34632 RepID=UPI0020C1F1C6|nr:breast cancer type 1 susceptibility protein homolog [Rhipicephalus sanguineus]